MSLSLVAEKTNLGITSWSNHVDYASYYASGAFSSNSESLLRLGVYDPTHSHSCLVTDCQMDIGEKFNCLAWGPSSRTDMSSGIIAGGMSDGSLMLWNADALMQPDRYENGLQDACLLNMDLYEQFFCLEFNQFKPELLATGGDQCYIVDIERDVSNPEVFQPSNNQNDKVVTSVSWNKNKVCQHILASAHEDGIVNILDLRKKGVAATFNDKINTSGRNIVVSWNPEIATQFATISDDPRSADLQIWDLRNRNYPIITKRNPSSTSGTHCQSWCPSNSSRILTADHDGCIIVWNYKTGEIELQENVDYNILSACWAPNLSSLLYINDDQGNQHMYTTDNDEIVRMQQSVAPKWLKNPVAVNFAPDNAVTTYNKSNPSVLNEKEISSSNWTNSIKKSQNEWASHLESGDVKEMCNNKAQYNNNSEEDGQMWSLIASSAGSQDEITKALGLDKEDIVSKTEKYTGKTHRVEKNLKSNGISPLPGKKGQTDTPSQPTKQYEFAEMDDNALEGFFDNLGGADPFGNPNEVESVTKGGSNIPISTAPKNHEKEHFYNLDTEFEVQEIQRNTNWNAGTEDLIRRNVLVGNFEGAIDCCMKAERFPEAFVLAYIKSQEKGSLAPIKLVLDEFMNTTNVRLFTYILQPMAENNWEMLVKGADLKRWKETASAICSNITDNNYKNQLLKKLATRQFDNKNKSAGVSLGLLSNDVEGVIDLLLQEIDAVFGDSDNKQQGEDQEAKVVEEELTDEQKNLLLIENLQKVYAICEAQGVKSSNKLLHVYLIRFAHQTLDYSEPVLAMNVQNSLGDVYDQTISILLNTIYHIYEPLLALFVTKPAEFRPIDISLPRTQNQSNQNTENQNNKTTHAQTNKPGNTTNPMTRGLASNHGPAPGVGNQALSNITTSNHNINKKPPPPKSTPGTNPFNKPAMTNSNTDNLPLNKVPLPPPVVNNKPPPPPPVNNKPPPPPPVVNTGPPKLNQSPSQNNMPPPPVNKQPPPPPANNIQTSQKAVPPPPVANKPPPMTNNRPGPPPPPTKPVSNNPMPPPPMNRTMNQPQTPGPPQVSNLNAVNKPIAPPPKPTGRSLDETKSMGSHGKNMPKPPPPPMKAGGPGNNKPINSNQNYIDDNDDRSRYSVASEMDMNSMSAIDPNLRMANQKPIPPQNNNMSKQGPVAPPPQMRNAPPSRGPNPPPNRPGPPAMNKPPVMNGNRQGPPPVAQGKPGVPGGPKNPNQANVDVASLVNSLEIALGSIPSIESDARNQQSMKTSLISLIDRVKQNAINGQVLEALSMLFNELGNNNMQGASEILNQMNSLCGPTDRNWMKTLGLVVNAFQ